MSTLNTKEEDIKLLWYSIERWLVPAEFARPCCIPLPSMPDYLDQEGDVIFSCRMLLYKQRSVLTVVAEEKGQTPQETCRFQMEMCSLCRVE